MSIPDFKEDDKRQGREKTGKIRKSGIKTQ
jgi:hypothetical protein